MLHEKKMNLDPAERLLGGEGADSVVKLMRMQQVFNSAILEMRTKLEILNEDFRLRFDRNPIHHIESRLKSVPSIVEKLVRKGCEVNTDSARKNLNDIAGIRVICYYIEDIYTVVDMLLRQDDIHLMRITDYIKKPKPSGYRSLHLVVRIPIFLSDRTEHIAVEIQFRTVAMDYWASLEHHLRYKTRNNLPDDLPQELRACADEITAIELRMQEIYNRLDELEHSNEESVPDE